MMFIVAAIEAGGALPNPLPKLEGRSRGSTTFLWPSRSPVSQGRLTLETLDVYLALQRGRPALSMRMSAMRMSASA